MEKKEKTFSQKLYTQLSNFGSNAHKVKHKPILCTGSGSFETRRTPPPRGPHGPRGPQGPRSAHPPWPRQRPAPCPRSPVPTRRRWRRRAPGADRGAAQRPAGNTPESRSPASAWWPGHGRGGRAPRRGCLAARPCPRGPPGTPRSRGGGSGSGLGARDGASRSTAGAREPRGQSSVSQETGHPSARDRGPLGEARAREDGAPLGGSGSEG